MDNYVTFIAGIFRSCRFGAASAHGKANMMQFAHFIESGAITRDTDKGYYTIDFEKMKKKTSKSSPVNTSPSKETATTTKPAS